MRTTELTGIDLNLLVALDVLVAERSVTRAAERMSVGQPAMSATLGRLRRIFDDPLLVRRGRGMVTTPMADSLVEPVREALSLIERALAARSEFDPTSSDRAFSLVASDFVTLVLLRPLLAALEEQAPGVRLHVRPVSSNMEDQLRSGRADLAIVPREVLGRSADLSSHPLFRDRYVLAVGGDNRHVGDSITLEEFSAQPYLAYDLEPLGSVVEKQLDIAGITRRHEVSIESFLLAPYLLQGTRLLSLVHERLARLVQQHLDIRILEPPLDLPPITEVMAWSPRREEDPAHRWLRDRLLDVASRL